VPDDALRGPTLLSIARSAIELPSAPAPRAWTEEWLRAPGASFVTLRLDGDLRGCIGSVEARRALGDDVTHNARAAAYRDLDAGEHADAAAIARERRHALNWLCGASPDWDRASAGT